MKTIKNKLLAQKRDEVVRIARSYQRHIAERMNLCENLKNIQVGDFEYSISTGSKSHELFSKEGNGSFRTSLNSCFYEDYEQEHLWNFLKNVESIIELLEKSEDAILGKCVQFLESEFVKNNPV